MARRRRPTRPGALQDLAPLRILTQIAALQLFYEGVAIVLIVFTSFVAGQHPNADMMLDWRNIRSDVTTGWTLALCWMLDSLITVIPILILIARSKLVPDFALTVHFLHLLIVSAYTRKIPSTPYWWIVQISSAALMVSLGIWACQWRELQPMMFGGNKTTSASPDEVQEEGEGYEMGGGSSRGADGAGAYEMVGMTSKQSG